MLVAPVVTFNPSPLRKYRTRAGVGANVSNARRPGLASTFVPLTSQISTVHIVKKPQALII